MSAVISTLAVLLCLGAPQPPTLDGGRARLPVQELPAGAPPELEAWLRTAAALEKGAAFRRDAPAPAKYDNTSMGSLDLRTLDV